MGELTESLASALLIGALPVFFLTFVIVQWSLKRGLFTGDSDAQLQTDIDQLRKRQKDGEDEAKDAPQLNPAERQWLQFGGRFYGMVALYTWLREEWFEVVDLLQSLGDLLRLDLSVLIDFFIDSLMNFVTAIAWPAYWLARVQEHQWLWVLLAYGAYLAGMRAARRYCQRQLSES
ncbi:MAG: hypothetical protein HRU51_07030 [Xanthomonadales bacterium]|nr:hypothetical protein [Xanthomonadales bacterium]